MACLLTQGYNFAGCKGGGGGIDEVLITEFANVISKTASADVYTAIGMTVGTQFRRYILDSEMGDHDDPVTYTKESGTVTYAPVVNFTIKGLTSALKAEIKLIAQNKLCMIVKDRNGVYWFYGAQKGMDLMTGSAGSGRALTDFNGFNLNFMGQETDYAKTVNPALIAALIIPAVP
jgi:hypothetical protein